MKVMGRAALADSPAVLSGEPPLHRMAWPEGGSHGEG